MLIAQRGDAIVHKQTVRKPCNTTTHKLQKKHVAERKFLDMAKCIYNLDVSQSLRYSLAVINILQGLASTFGNILVFVLVIYNKRLRTRSNAFLLSLATSDFLVGAILGPMFVVQFFSHRHRENCGFNMIRRYLSTLLMGGAVGSIALVSYDRWTHLTKTIRYKEFMSKRKVAILITIVWIIPGAIPLARLTSEAAYSTIIIIYVCVIFALMTTCYFVIAKKVRSSELNLRQATETNLPSRTTTNHIRVAKAVILVILCLLVTIMPVSIYHGVTALNGFSTGMINISDDTKEICYAVLMTIGLANSGINPIIYYFRIPEFRKSMKCFVAWFLKRRNPNECSRSADPSHETTI